MTRLVRSIFVRLPFLLLLLPGRAASQCTTPGQTPSTAFPVCGTTVFHQTTVPICTNKQSLFVNGCSDPIYSDRNPFYYKFTCFVSGTLGFTISPIGSDEDYDWQLYDITGKNPDIIFTDNTTFVCGNWAGTYGPTGAGPGGVPFTQCSSNPAANAPTFAAMPNLVAGHQYLLLISHFSDGQSGYNLSFGGGNAVITDPLLPHLKEAKAGCDGKTLTLKLNKKIRCNSLTAAGTEFSLLPAATTVTAAATTTCSPGFEFDELTLTFAGALPSNSYQLVINNGSDGNTLLDICGNAITQGERILFDYSIPQPILADSVAKPGCATDSILLYYPKKIRCSTISPSGTDFLITGPTTVNVIGANGSCVNDLSEYVVIKLAAPLYTKGDYTLAIVGGIDGSPVLDLCGQPILPQTLGFSTADTVNAAFTFENKMGCQRDTLTFAHNGAHDVNKWTWQFNNGSPVTTQSHTIIFPATSTNNISLIVDNGTCKDTAEQTMELDNEVKAKFSMSSIICPEDKLELINSTEGTVDIWRWNYDVISTSHEKDPAPYLMPNINKEMYYTIKLVATNSTIGCSDSTRMTLTVLDHCVIAVPTGFTPNNDGLNDAFRPHNAIKADNYEFKVFNRWGQLIFFSRNWQDKWDGRLKGVLQNSGVYVWMLRYKHRESGKEIFEKGTVMLIR